ncbi:MAG: sugar ABC transporter ATP-binding protein, partial [Lachnospiraceae bacterium]|nr:sugar ABC transporter ATP-binding protein [Lachnospiraceae bacterium]
NDLSVKCAEMNQYVSALSGGNKQKVVFGKWIGRGSEILILDCPTRGVDIGVKQAMYQLMYRMKKEGKSIIIISEEMTELIGMADRLIVMKDGEIKKEFPRSEALSESDIIQYMI